MTILVVLELVTFYIMFQYLNDMDGYGFIVVLRIGMVLVIGGSNR